MICVYFTALIICAFSCRIYFYVTIIKSNSKFKNLLQNNFEDLEDNINFTAPLRYDENIAL